MKIIVVLISFLICVSTTAQRNAVVHLTNGSAVRGEVIENDSTGIKLRTRDGSYWNFSTDQIIKIETFIPEIRESGFYNKTSIGFLGGNQFSGSLRVVNGYSINRHWDIGLGVGLEAMRWNPYFPIFAEGRYSILQGPTRPFVSVHAGYAMAVSNMEFNKGGFTGGADLGVTHYFSRHTGISTSLGYRYAYLVEKSAWWDDFTTISQINRFEIRLGLVFR